MRRMVRTHKFRGIKHVIDIEGYKGEYSPKGIELPAITIARPVITMRESLPYGNAKYAKLMAYILEHECLHACFPSKSEASIDQAAKDISSLRWRLGYRRVK